MRSQTRVCVIIIIVHVRAIELQDAITTRRCALRNANAAAPSHLERAIDFAVALYVLFIFTFFLFLIELYCLD